MTDRRAAHPGPLHDRAPKRALLGLWIVLAVAAGIRFAALESKPLWCDELATLQRLSLPLRDHLAAMGGNHPLYEILLRLWMPLDGTDRWMRQPSAALGVLAVWLTWRLMRRAGRGVGLLAAGLMALAPLHVLYSRIARAYSLSMALALASHLALLWAIRSRRWMPAALYALAAAALVASNLFALSVVVAQGIFVLWFYRGRWRRLWRAGVAVLVALAALLPFIAGHMADALTWSFETAYTARQFGIAAKACYLPLTLSLGETVHPLNLWVIVPAFLGFGAAMAVGAWHAARRGRNFAVYLLMQVVVVLAFGLLFPSAAPKHLLVALPAWCGLLALGLARMRRGAGLIAGAIIVATMLYSLANYALNRQFADADMVTPWREMAAAVARAERPGDALIIGYQMDRGAYDMFRRYYRGGLAPEYLPFADWPAHLTIPRHGDLWLLLHHGDPWEEIERWLSSRGARWEMQPFQEEEHTLQGLREGWRNAGKYRSALYRLYRVSEGAE